jgi:hypothetical protein
MRRRRCSSQGVVTAHPPGRENFVGKHPFRVEAKAGDLAAAREVADRLDGKLAQAIECGDAPVTQLTDAQLYEIAAGRLTESEGELKALPAPGKSAA